MGRGPLRGEAARGGEGDDLGGKAGFAVVAEELRVAETAVPIATLGVQDAELGPPPRRSVPAWAPRCLGPLADDVAAEPDPGLPLELEPEPGRFGDRRRETVRQARRLEGHEKRLGPPSQAGQAAQSLSHLGRRRADGGTGWQIDDEDVDGA